MSSSRKIVVIGAGPAGYVCAIRLAQLGQMVTVVEKEYLGAPTRTPEQSLCEDLGLAYHYLTERFDREHLTGPETTQGFIMPANGEEHSKSSAHACRVWGALCAYGEAHDIPRGDLYASRREAARRSWGALCAWEAATKFVARFEAAQPQPTKRIDGRD